MLCSKCHQNEATVFIKQNINGEVKEYALCANCAEESELGFTPVNLFGSLFPSAKVKREQKNCTLCNSTFDEIRHNGKVGCSECYNVFKNELAPMISNIHSGAKHCGRAPGGYAEKRKAENELAKLKQELQHAIANEEYEKAARLRDTIKEKEAE